MQKKCIFNILFLLLLLPTYSADGQTRYTTGSYQSSVNVCSGGNLVPGSGLDIKDLNALQECIKNWRNCRGDIKNYDINFDRKLNWDDVLQWIKCSKGTCIGDVNLDGIFDSTDLAVVFEQGKFEVCDGSATWSSGDWNGDGCFDNSDLLLAFKEGCFEDFDQY